VAGLIVEVEVARRALLEPQPVVLRRVLQELGRLLENVVIFPRRRTPGTSTFLGLAAATGGVLDVVLDRFVATGWSFWRLCLCRWRILGRNALSPRSPPTAKSTLTLMFRSGRRLGGFAV
jgi:hypothetical protein